jgi:hypothetical protein
MNELVRGFQQDDALAALILIGAADEGAPYHEHLSRPSR